MLVDARTPGFPFHDDLSHLLQPGSPQVVVDERGRAWRMSVARQGQLGRGCSTSSLLQPPPLGEPAKFAECAFQEASGDTAGHGGQSLVVPHAETQRLCLDSQCLSMVKSSYVVFLSSGGDAMQQQLGLQAARQA